MSSFWLKRLYNARQRNTKKSIYDKEESSNSHSLIQIINSNDNPSDFLRSIRNFVRKHAALFDTSKGCSPGEKYLLLHQHIVSLCVQSHGPISKLLVCHRPGSGKTRTMAALCDNFYNDGRPIVVLVPNKTIVRKFLRTLLSVSGQWSIFVKRIFKQNNLSHSNLSDIDLVNILALRNGNIFRQVFQQYRINNKKKKHIKNTTNLLYETAKNVMLEDEREEEQEEEEEDDENNIHSNQGIGGLPAAPLYIVSYDDVKDIKTFMINIADGQELSKIRINWGKEEGWKVNKGNLMDRCVILVDEVHKLYTNALLTRKKKENDRSVVDTTDYLLLQPNLGILKSKISLSKQSVVVGFTATPVITPTTTGWRHHRSISYLMREWNRQLHECVQLFKNNENNINNNNKRTSFAPDFSGYVSYFDTGDGHIFPRLTSKTRWTLHGEIDDSSGKEVSAILPVKVHMVTLHGLNLIMYMQKLQINIDKVLKDDEDIELMMMPWCNQVIREVPHTDYIPSISAHQKMHLVAKSIEENPVKTLILVEREDFAYIALIERYLHKRNITVDRLRLETQQHQLERFNDLENNDMGQDILCLVAEVDTFVESSDFLTVRKLILINPPSNLGSLQQLVGRITRSCAFSSRFTAKNQHVEVDMYVAQLPTNLQSRLLQSYVMFVKEISKMFAKTKTIAATILREIGIDDDIATDILYAESAGLDENENKENNITMNSKFSSFVNRIHRDNLNSWERWHQHDRLLLPTNTRNSSFSIGGGATRSKNIKTSNPNDVQPEGLMTVDMLRATRLVREQCAYCRYVRKNIIDKAIDADMY